MRVLVTGGAGYIGTPLCTALAQRHEVTCWDPGFFGDFFGPHEDAVRRVRRRVQAMTLTDVERIAPDWILHLSGLSNDPMADFAPHMNWVENMDATCHVGRLAAKRSIPLLFASSASVYGFNDSGVLDEDAHVAPIGHYSRSKAAAEQWLQEHHPHPVILRQATVMGVSPRMRFDLLTNGMAEAAWSRGKLRVLYGGRETRAQVHVADLVRAYARVLDTPELPAGVYNVASSNDSVMQLAEAIRQQLTRRRHGGVEIEVTDEPREHRSYALSADKLRSATGWEPRHGVPSTVDEVCRAIDDGRADPADPKAYNIQWMRLLYEAQNILERTGPIDVRQQLDEVLEDAGE